MDSLNKVSDSENNLEDTDVENANYLVSESSNNSNGSEIQNQNDQHKISPKILDVSNKSTSSSSELQTPLEALRKSSHEASTCLSRSLRIMTSMTSASSASQREVLTVNTDYRSCSSGASSLLLGVFKQTNQPHFKLESRNQNIETTIQIATSDLSDLPPPRDHIQRRNRFIRRSRNRRWISKCCNNNDLPEADEDNDNQPYSRGPPPSYSSIYRPIRNEPLLTFFPVDNQSSFEAPTPPPSYAQAEGICMASYSMDNLIPVSSSSGRFLSAQSTAIFCPRCTTFVLTVVDVHRSMDTHIMALLLLMCGCWPCCMIPYCVDSCQTVHHYCPICRSHLGTYTPW